MITVPFPIFVLAIIGACAIAFVLSWLLTAAGFRVYEWMTKQ